MATPQQYATLNSLNNGFWPKVKAAVQNMISRYLPLAGGTITGQIKSAGGPVPWIRGRDAAPLRLTTADGYRPITSVKTTNGSWEIGHYKDTNYQDKLLFTYITNANYNAGTNAVTQQFCFNPDGSITGATFPWGNISGKPSIPSVGNGTVTIKQNGASKGSFTMNQSGATTIELTDNNTVYSLPTASASTLGGVKVGANLTISNGVLAGTPNTTYSTATTSAAGLMSSADKSKLDGIAAGATKNPVDTALSTTSTNAVQNKAVTAALNGKAATSHNHDTAYLRLAGGTMAGNITMNGKAIVSDTATNANPATTIYFPIVRCPALGLSGSTGSTPQEFTPLLLKWLCGRYTLGAYGTRFLGTGNIATDCAYDIWISGNEKNSANMPRYASFLAYGPGYFFRGWVSNYNFSITVM